VQPFPPHWYREHAFSVSIHGWKVLVVREKGKKEKEVGKLTVMNTTHTLPDPEVGQHRTGGNFTIDSAVSRSNVHC
jgi:hypothetical protein